MDPAEQWFAQALDVLLRVSPIPIGATYSASTRQFVHLPGQLHRMRVSTHASRAFP